MGLFKTQKMAFYGCAKNADRDIFGRTQQKMEQDGVSNVTKLSIIVSYVIMLLIFIASSALKDTF